MPTEPDPVTEALCIERVSLGATGETIAQRARATDQMEVGHE